MDRLDMAMMDKSELLKKVKEDEDYIRCPKFSNSLTRFLSKNSEGVENSTIARFLMVSEQEVEKIYEEAVRMLRSGMEE